MKKSDIEYWRDRQLEDFTNGEKLALELSKKLKNNYEIAIADIEKNINAFYGKFARENGITLQEAKKLLSTKELKSFIRQIEEYINYAENNKLANSYISELNTLKYRTKVTRLDELEINLKYELAKLIGKNQTDIINELINEYDEAYLSNIFNFNKNLGLSISFGRPPIDVVNKYLSQNINVANYAIGKNQVWHNRLNALTNILNTKIPQGIILGQNPKKVARIAEKALDTDYNATVRLVRTEYNYIYNQATADSYIACGVSRYQILATLDERTCDSCGPLDLQIVNLADKEVGINYPPFHPNCRCTTIPYFEKDEFDIKGQRIAKDKNGQPYMVPEDLTYEEWKKGLSEHEGGFTYWKPKGE